MGLKNIAATASLVVLLALAACSPTERAEGSDESSPTARPPESVTPSASTSSAASGAGSEADDVTGTVVRFSSRATSIDVTIDQDNPAVRSFLSMLTLTLTVEEFAGREKIAYLPRELEHRGSPGSDPEDGDLIYYVPWGNLGFYYNTAGVDYSNQTIHLGTYDASREQLEQLEGENITVEIAG